MLGPSSKPNTNRYFQRACGSLSRVLLLHSALHRLVVRSTPKIFGPSSSSHLARPGFHTRSQAAHHKVPKRIRKSRRTYRLRINFLDRPARPPTSKMRCQLTLSEFWPVLHGVETAVSPGGAQVGLLHADHWLAREQLKRLCTTKGPCSTGFQGQLQSSAATSARSLSSSATSQRILDEARLSFGSRHRNRCSPVLARVVVIVDVYGGCASLVRCHCQAQHAEVLAGSQFPCRH